MNQKKNNLPMPILNKHVVLEANLNSGIGTLLKRELGALKEICGKNPDTDQQCRIRFLELQVTHFSTKKKCAWESDNHIINQGSYRRSLAKKQQELTMEIKHVEQLINNYDIKSPIEKMREEKYQQMLNNNPIGKKRRR